MLIKFKGVDLSSLCLEMNWFIFVVVLFDACAITPLLSSCAISSEQFSDLTSQFFPLPYSTAYLSNFSTVKPLFFLVNLKELEALDVRKHSASYVGS